MKLAAGAVADSITTGDQTARKPSRRPRQRVPRHRTPLASVRRFNTLVLKFTDELLGNRRTALTTFEREMVRQAAALTLRAEQLQAGLLRGETVDPDELIRVTSEMRRAVKALGFKVEPPAPPPQPRFSPMKALREAAAAKAKAQAEKDPSNDRPAAD